ncbi:NUDIX hydrolase [Streptacidiphilus carbonis]|uniref:NUDIX hydrolase n=1 Tax=Streptacidiphilus carbonis TaxID=105422 RepID=UPI0005A86CF2|nr:NUDIX domain-containing protein [Streptacidiphilus carbonis]
MSTELPAGWAERIAALSRGELEPVPPRPAATVVLLRERRGGGGAEAYLLRRRTSMAFAGGMYAFPGGGVDLHDGTSDLGWAGPPAEEWGARLGCAPQTARAVVCAAVRETFEESGVLLAGVDPSSVVADVSGDEWRSDRAALEAHRLTFAEFLTRRRLVLRSDLLRGWARWVTPEFEERRYDTWFFVAAVPEGQRTAEVPGEADRVEWLDPGEAVRRFESGAYRMLPPTVTTLRELSPHADPGAALAAADQRRVELVMAEASLNGDGRVTVRWPGHPELTMGAKGAEK